jgi:GT2 family glycosyltransferase
VRSAVNKEPRVCVVIVNWNGERDTLICLQSLLALNYANFQVVISDNGSRSQSLDVIKKWIGSNSGASAPTTGGLACVVIENGKNLGFTGANTVGIKYALAHEADYVLFLNNDTIVTPDFLTKMIEAGESDPKIGIVGCKIFYSATEDDGRHKIWSLGGYSFAKGMPVNIASGEYDRADWRGIRLQELINGCCMLIKRGVIESVGVQDDRLFFGMDDVEYSFRVARNGWKNLVNLDAVIYHSASQSVVSHADLQIYYLFRNVLIFRSSSFAWYQNLAFYFYFGLRYVMIAGLYRWLVGRSQVNVGMFLAIRDFMNGVSGECKHLEILPSA